MLTYHLHLMLRLRMSATIVHSHYMLSWSVQGQRYLFSWLLWISSRPSQFNKGTRFSVTELLSIAFICFADDDHLITYRCCRNCGECIHPVMGTARYRKLCYLMCLVAITTALAKFEIHMPIYKKLQQCKKTGVGGGWLVDPWQSYENFCF